MFTYEIKLKIAGILKQTFTVKADTALQAIDSIAIAVFPNYEFIATKIGNSSI